MTCAECGATGQTQAFCSECGEFLQWERGSTVVGPARNPEADGPGPRREPPPRARSAEPRPAPPRADPRGAAPAGGGAPQPPAPRPAAANPPAPPAPSSWPGSAAAPAPGASADPYAAAGYTSRPTPDASNPYKTGGTPTPPPAPAAPSAPAAPPAPAAPGYGGTPNLHRVEQPGSEHDTEDLPDHREVASRTERARALLVPVEAANPQAPPPADPAAPVQPGRADRERPRRVRRLAAEEEPLDGLACPWCHTVNPETRHYCRRCAMLLTVSGTSERQPWWRRMFGRDGGRVPMAGERPRVRGLRARWPIWALRAVVAAAIVTALVIWTQPGVEAAEDHFTTPVPIHASSVTASHSDPGHPATNLVDGYNTTWWGDGVDGSGAGQYVTASFALPVHLLYLMITPGAGTDQNAFNAQARPLAVDITVLHADNTTTVVHATLNDAATPQAIPVRGRDVEKLRVTLRQAYGVGAKKEVAIAELEFFGKSAATTSR
ncbi:hypothetical protein BIV57_16700 [Mangrovactinospora gilvigrisea]|uniref:NAD glycohydrolase translocation F5/8 type C domain-containing protein n=1 Tax=Mangrovactinospora gilvigrisea TaxID=1428644 RepID=A0A1J7C464_9ACTN|nr:hypothetical protein [Mangrovactinospora gilvigrisea]OIV36364.1 hypothetical protein BIV57_16700 [Mangrovactinospora gilvigrisea]